MRNIECRTLSAPRITWRFQRIIAVLMWGVVLPTIGATLLCAQPADTITANPKAQALRRVWAAYGADVVGGARVGQGIGGIPDVNGDGIDEFAVFYGSVNEWRVFYGSKGEISSEPAVVFKGYGAVPSYPIVGDFWGTGHKAVAFPRGINDTSNGNQVHYPRFFFFRSENGGLDTTPSAVLDPRTMHPRTRWTARQICGADLDGDGADELILYMPGVFRDDVPYFNPEVWIYRGGPNFQVDSPTVVLRDPQENDGGGYESLVVGHWDHDQRLDLMTLRRYPDKVYRTKFWFSREGSPWNWTVPDRTIEFGAFSVVAADYDGDSVLDIVAPPRADSSGRVQLFLSGGGKSIRTRSLLTGDADRMYYRAGYGSPARIGYLSDSLRRYEMLAIFGGPGPTFLGFSGSPSGPDHQYDLFSHDVNFALLEGLGDVTGDGWNDVMGSYYRDNNDAGVAMVYAGGPYIPGDPVAGVEEIAIAGLRDAVHVWPNPVVEEVHVAWRGDLARMPELFVVHDFSGRLVARGEVEAWRGEAIWKCAAQPAGIYILSLFDHNKELIATHRILKQ